MLLITRREGEAIVVNGTIEVRVLEIRGGRVKLGFDYPAGNSVFRQELFAKIQAENQAAAHVPHLTQAADAGRLQAALGVLGKTKGGTQVGTDSAQGMGNKKAQNHDNRDDHDDEQ
jgi:carbon storage regulator